MVGTYRAGSKTMVCNMHYHDIGDISGSEALFGPRTFYGNLNSLPKMCGDALVVLINVVLIKQMIKI